MKKGNLMVEKASNTVTVLLGATAMSTLYFDVKVLVAYSIYVDVALILLQ